MKEIKLRYYVPYKGGYNPGDGVKRFTEWLVDDININDDICIHAISCPRCGAIFAYGSDYWKKIHTGVIYRCPVCGDSRMEGADGGN